MQPPIDHRPGAQIQGRAVFPHAHLTGISGLQPHEILFLLDEAEQWIEANRSRAKSDHRLDGLTQINAFFENSTRTLLSFEIAGKRLGADVVNMHAAQSSVKKGETLIDTAMTLNAMRADVIVIRHMSSGAVQLIADKVDCPVLNAGDGSHEHPTQALLDAFTMRRHFRGLDHDHGLAGKSVVIVGDVTHSRVARSNVLLLQTLGAEVVIVAPPTLLPSGVDRWPVRVLTDLDEALPQADVVMMLRVQRERMSGGYFPTAREYTVGYGLTRDRLCALRPGVAICHPGPMNRGLEISADAADAANSLILDQVAAGVSVRMSVLYQLLGGEE